jgi:CRISPR/Cas system endoribonuclease Cas6 (RAMP superfamily)
MCTGIYNVISPRVTPIKHTQRLVKGPQTHYKNLIALFELDLTMVQNSHWLTMNCFSRLKQDGPLLFQIFHNNAIIPSEKTNQIML